MGCRYRVARCVRLTTEHRRLRVISGQCCTGHDRRCTKYRDIGSHHSGANDRCSND